MSTARMRYQTFEIGDLDIHVRTLRDKNQFQDTHGDVAESGVSSATWSLSGVVWPAAEELARRMVDLDVEGLRILEVGCGIGLASLVLHKRGADILATDHHPETGDWLAYNTTLNGGGSLAYHRADWTDPEVDLGSFDLIIGSDVLYETYLVEDLASFIDRHARPAARVIIVDPGRASRGKFEKAMAEHGFTHRREPWREGEGKGQVLILEREG